MRTAESPEKSYTKKSSRNMITVLEELDFHWCEDVAIEVVNLWEDGVPFEGIVAHCERDPYEVVLLLLQMARDGKIQIRAGGIFGSSVR